MNLSRVLDYKGAEFISVYIYIYIYMYIYKCMTLVSKNVYIDKLDGIVNECSNTYYKTIKIKPVDVK